MFCFSVVFVSLLQCLLRCFYDVCYLYNITGNRLQLPSWSFQNRRRVFNVLRKLRNHAIPTTLLKFVYLPSNRVYCISTALVFTADDVPGAYPEIWIRGVKGWGLVPSLPLGSPPFPVPFLPLPLLFPSPLLRSRPLNPSMGSGGAL